MRRVLSAAPGQACATAGSCALRVRRPGHWLIGPDTWISSRWFYGDDGPQPGCPHWLDGPPADVARRIAWVPDADLFQLPR